LPSLPFSPRKQCNAISREISNGKIFKIVNNFFSRFVSGLAPTTAELKTTKGVVMEDSRSLAYWTIRNDQVNAVDWTVITQAADVDSPAATEAREVVCRAYWEAVYKCVRRQGYPPHDAEDWTQQFFLMILERNSFANADSTKGTFESYLFGALKHFLANARAKASAAKRGGKVEFVSLRDSHTGEAIAIADPHDGSPDAVCDEHGTEIVMKQALTRLREQFELAGKARQFEILAPFLVAKGRRGDYESIALRLEMTRSEITMAVHRMRHKLKALLGPLLDSSLGTPFRKLARKHRSKQRRAGGIRHRTLRVTTPGVIALQAILCIPL
jgi:RNA polymerase sigma factor (sigma-70 family)